MKIIDIDTLKIKDIADNLHECSCCGKYYKIQDFNDDNLTVKTRTNCKKCYNLKWEEMRQLSEKIEKIKKSPAYRKVKNELKKLKEIEENSMDVEDLIQELQKLPKGSKVLIKQEGYYVEEEFGYFHKPEEIMKNHFIIGYGGSSAYC